MYSNDVKISYTKFKLYLIAFLAVMGVLFGPHYVNAKTTSLDNIAEIGLMTFMPKEEFKEKTRPIEYIPYDDIHLGYRVDLPKDWSDNIAKSDILLNEGVLGKKVLGVLAHYASPASVQHARSFFTVEAMQLTYEIGVKNWFINYALTNGLSIERISVKNKKELEVIYVEVRKDTTFIVRAKVMINGSKLIVARYYVSQQQHKAEKVMQAQSIDSFKLMSIDHSTIEKLQTYGFLNQSYFDYPPSWKLDSFPVKSLQRMRAELHQRKVPTNLEGKIDILVTNKLTVPNRSDVIKNFRKNFAVNEYKIDKFIGEPDFEYHKDISFGVTQVYELNPLVANMISYELWVSVLEGEDYIYMINLMSPSRDEDFYTWSRNVESYKLVVKSMRRNNGSNSFFEFVR